MYNFFNKRVNKRAFIKALKEVKQEGYYVDAAVNDDVVFTTNMSRAVASLSGEEAKKPYVQDQALDISEFTPNLDNERVKPANPDTLGSNKQFVKQSRSQFYEKLFSEDDAFLDGTKVQERGLLSNETDSDDGFLRPRASSSSNSQISRDEIIRRTKQKLEELNAAARARVEENKKRAEEQKRIEAEKQAAIRRAEQEAKEAEKTRLAAEQLERERKEEEERLAAEKLAAEKAAQAKIVVEVVKPEPIVVPSAPATSKTTRKPRTTKKRRRYDADIAGGFDF